MSTPFQNRLVGTVIVAAIAIIFLPDILDGDKKTYQEEFDRIPEAPKVEFSSKNKQFPTEELSKLPKEEINDESALDDLPRVAEKVDEDSSETTTANSTDIIVNPPIESESFSDDEKPLAKAVADTAWVIQLGSFRHQNNVNELVKKLKSSGYQAFTKPIKTKRGTLTKVFVGPELIKSSLEKKIPALRKLTNVEGKIARFSPVKQ